MSQSSDFDFEGSYQQRSLEARCLYNEQYYHSSIYLLGYALECVLKTYIRKVKRQDPPWTHSIESLREKAGIPKRNLLGSQQAIDIYLDKMINDENWVNMRYRINDFSDYSEQQIKALFDQICKIIRIVRKGLS